MQIKIKSFLFALSVLLNAFVVLLVIVSVSSSSETSSFSFLKPQDHITAAALVSVPESASAVVESININISPRQKAYLQFSVISGKNKQGNLLFNALYDPHIVSISQTGFGLEITALSEGSTVIQTLANDGIKDVAFVTVTDITQ